METVFSELDSWLVLAILLANGVFGFVQDHRDERTSQALRELSTPDATVLRDGEARTIDSREVVPGDVIVIEQGEAVAGDPGQDRRTGTTRRDRRSVRERRIESDAGAGGR